MMVKHIYPSIAAIPTTESEVLYQSQHFDAQAQINFQQQQQRQEQQQKQEQQPQQQDSYLDPAPTQNDLRIFTQGLVHNPSYDTPVAQYPASHNSEGSIDMWGGAMNWVDGQNAPMRMHPYLHNQPPLSVPPYSQALSSPTDPCAQALSSPTQSLSPREPNTKRDASTAASARFRQKKKLREKSLETSVKEQKEKIGMMECRIKELEDENGFLKELVMGRIKWKEERDNEEKSSEEKDQKDDWKTE